MEKNVKTKFHEEEEKNQRQKVLNVNFISQFTFVLAQTLQETLDIQGTKNIFLALLEEMAEAYYFMAS